MIHVIIDSDNGLLPVRHQAIIGTNAGFIVNLPLEYISEKLIPE